MTSTAMASMATASPTADVIDLDDDNDGNGLSDDLQIAPFNLVDTDRDRIPDFRDLDSDNDGLTDLFENGGNDDNNDGRIDGFIDANGDGADDVLQMAGTGPRDSDGDGVPNHLDLDSDNDGNSDASEAGAVANAMLDTDGDGIPDSVDVSQTGGDDADGDGIDDRFDASFILTDDTDGDGDGIIDSADPDANGDGLADDPQNALALGQALPDTNGNGIADIFDADSGILRTGLDGRGGCSISGPTGNRGSFDPLFALMISVIAAIAWRRRSIRNRAKKHKVNARTATAVAAPILVIILVFTAAATLAPTTTYADRNGLRPWLGGGIGLSRLRPDASEISESVTDDNSTAYSFMLGLDINHRFGVQLGYTDLGQAELSDDNNITYSEISGDLLVYALARKFRREHRLGFLPFARVGLSKMNNDATLPFERVNDLSINFGAGLEYATRSGLAARAEITSFDTDATQAGISLLYRFGGHNSHTTPSLPPHYRW